MATLVLHRLCVRNGLEKRLLNVLEMSTRGKGRGNTESESRVAEAISEALSLWR